MAFSLNSPAFQENETFPLRYTREAENISPPLQWTNPPAGTREFVLICEDPDAPREKPFVHWIVYRIESQVRTLAKGIPWDQPDGIPASFRQGRNSYGHLGYDGPEPPIGDKPHHYHFRLYALDTDLDLAPGADHEQVLKAMKGHVLSATELVSMYQRKAA